MDSASSVPPTGLKRLEALAVDSTRSQLRNRTVPDEVPVAFVYNGHSQAVMMATPADLEDFAVGFSLAEQIIESSAQIAGLAVIRTDKGIRVELRVPDEVVSRLVAERHRSMVGNSGCGLCGVDTLEQVEKRLTPVGTGLSVDFVRIRNVLSALADQQRLNADARAIHAAAFADRDGQILQLREDVGRHNAMDKLIGALARSSMTVDAGFCLITSRCSYEMVQKAAVAGFQVLVAISAPTATAVRIARDTGMTLIALAREDGMLVFNDRDRVQAGGVDTGSRNDRFVIRDEA